eukprot:3772763-Rhodomonas_salina.1
MGHGTGAGVEARDHSRLEESEARKWRHIACANVTDAVPEQRCLELRLRPLARGAAAVCSKDSALSKRTMPRRLGSSVPGSVCDQVCKHASGDPQLVLVSRPGCTLSSAVL